ncbi:hypothetical protein X975_10952, partial [Stegodyphus mimosarum]
MYFMLGCFPRGKLSYNSKLAYYADDTVMAIRSIQPNNVISILQDIVLGIEEWCCHWRIVINALKSKLLLVHGKRINNVTVQSLFLFGTQVLIIANVSYLRVHLNWCFTWDNHFRYATNKTNTVLDQLIVLL